MLWITADADGGVIRKIAWKNKCFILINKIMGNKQNTASKIIEEIDVHNFIRKYIGYFEYFCFPSEGGIAPKHKQITLKQIRQELITIFNTLNIQGGSDIINDVKYLIIVSSNILKMDIPNDISQKDIDSYNVVKKRISKFCMEKCISLDYGEYSRIPPYGISGLDDFVIILSRGIMESEMQMKKILGNEFESQITSSEKLELLKCDYPNNSNSFVNDLRTLINKCPSEIECIRFVVDKPVAKRLEIILKHLSSEGRMNGKDFKIFVVEMEVVQNLQSTYDTFTEEVECLAIYRDFRQLIIN